MLVTLASRFDMAKKAAIAAMSHTSSSLKPWALEGGDIGIADGMSLEGHLHGEVEHGLLPGRDVGLAVIDGDLIGDQRVLGADAQDRAMGDDAVLALIGIAGRHHDHLALGLGEIAGLVHQRVVIGEEGAKLVGPVSQHQKDVRHEAGFLLNRQDSRTDVLRQIRDLRNGKAADRRLAHR